MRDASESENKISGLAVLLLPEEKNDKECMVIQEDKITVLYPKIYRYALVQLKKKEDAQDITQEVFYRYLHGNYSFASEEKEMAWLFRVTANLCKSYWRSSWYKRVVPIQNDDLCICDNHDVQKICEEAETVERILSLVTRLPQKYREVVHLYYYEDMKIQEIADILGRKVSTIQTQLERSRKRLKKLLTEEEDGLF